MDVGSIIRKILNGKAPRELYDVPVALASDVSLDALADAATDADVVNQLGVLVDITLQGVMPEDHPRYQAVQSLRSKLRLRMAREPEMQAFYKTGHPDVMLQVQRSTERLNTPEMNAILREWGVTTVLTPEKFKQVYEQYEHRQATADSYSSGN